jgi:prephenate dehydrogenase
MKIAILGGSGKMGQWFARFLKEDGHDVVITGRNQSRLQAAAGELGVRAAGNQEAVREADVVIISVPLDTFEATVIDIAPATSSRQMIFDLTSVKTVPVEIMHRHIKKGVILGAHPVFGPGASSLARQNFVLTPTQEKETTLAQGVAAYLEVRGASVSIMTPREHDAMMSVILGLAHYIAIVSADALLSFPDFPRMQAIGGITYRALLTLVESVLSEDPQLYASLQLALPDMAKTENVFIERAALWANLVQYQKKEEFIQRMTDLRRRLEAQDPGFGEAYQRMYRLGER